jgi:hypothetical protein
MKDILVQLEVDRLFRKLPARRGELCWNPVTGGLFVKGLDPIKPQKERAYRALVAREWFALNGPPDAPPLPLSYEEREALKHGGVLHILAWYARSLEARDYAVEEHPSFDLYARGVMASSEAPEFITEDEQLKKRFPPASLAGIGPGLGWWPPEEHSKTKASRRPSQAHTAAADLRVEKEPRTL